MRIRTRTPYQIALYLIVVLISNIRNIYAQPEFPNPNILFQQTHEGNLILSGSQIMTIENTDYKVTGDIVLQDNSQLIIRHSIIELLGAIGSGRAIHLQDSSLLKADTTIFGGVSLIQGIDYLEKEMIKPGDIITDNNSQLIMNNCFSLLQTFMGNSVATVRNSYFAQKPLGLVHVEGNADVLFEDSFVGAFFITVPDSMPVTLDSLVPGYFEYWSAKEKISDSLTYNLILHRTEVMENTEGYKGGMEIGWNISVNILKTMMTISNSKLNKLILIFPPGEPASISDLVIGEPVSFDLNNIHVVNTEIQTQWGVFMNGDPAEIINSEGLFIFMTGGNADILVFNSEVGEIDPRDYTGTLIFEKSTWLGGYEIFENSHIKIRGSVRMLPTVPIFDENSTMTRTFDVSLLDDNDGSPFDNVNLTLTKNGSTVWNGTTDAQGNVSFDISFDINNSEDEWKLRTDANNINLNKTFSIYISNPVKINLELDTDSVYYRPVLHVAADNPDFPYGTRENPYPTIQEGIDNSGGDVVYVHPGTYKGEIAPGKTRGGIALKDSVTILGTNADLTILTGNVNAEEISGAHIGGFKIEDGIHALSASLTLKNSVISDYEGTAIWGSKSNFHVINNVLANNGLDAIFLHDSSTAIIKNNIIVNNAGYGIIGLESASATIDYNDVWGNTENYFELFIAGEHDISADPIFVDAGSGIFHLQNGSPCIDAGDPAPIFNDPDGSRNDMGAFGGPFAPDIKSSIENITSIIPRQNTLLQNYPNPFNPSTIIKFQISNSQFTTLKVYNILGQKIAILLNKPMPSGYHEIEFNGQNLSSGVYLYKIEAGEWSDVKKMLIVR